MIKKIILLCLIHIPLIGFAQRADYRIKLELKPEDPKKAYEMEILKTNESIKIVYRTVDSIAKIEVPTDDMQAIKRLVAKKTLDSLESDSLYHFQQQIDSLKKAKTYFKSDSTVVFSSTHKNYFQFVETVLKSSDQVLTGQMAVPTSKTLLSCFLTMDYPNLQSRYLFIEALDPKSYPMVSKLVQDTEVIIRAHKSVMQKKNQ
ncbi:MAG: hypothetical protein REI78_05890 [Pedobacter sp.]|nr:hypothetical protein [Pedobacter sp.]MDQ8052534.1 hypothetical protein [Pedobacter sp.]